MKLIFTWNEILVYKSTDLIMSLPASCKVRHELNRQRKPDQIVYTIPVEGKAEAYYPRQFPGGIFSITEVIYTDDKTYAPVKIKTTATRKVFTWELDNEKEYWYPSGRIQEDTSYWLHYTESITTLGCIRIHSKPDALALAKIVERELKTGEKIYLEVL